jgi:peroxin-1
MRRRFARAPDIKQDAQSPLNFTALATQTEGYSATDLQDLAARAVHQAAIRSTKKDTEVAEVKFFEHHTQMKKKY